MNHQTQVAEEFYVFARTMVDKATRSVSFSSGTAPGRFGHSFVRHPAVA